MRALLVIDIQDTYITKYESDLLKRINERIKEAHNNHYNIVYVKNTKKLRSGKTTDEFADGLFIVSDDVFYKEQANAFASEELIAYFKSKNISEVEIIGIDGNICIYASAKGAIEQGFDVTIFLEGVGVGNSSRFEATKEQLLQLGVILK